MSPTVIGFIKTSLLSLAAGVILGVLMALQVLPDAERPTFITSAHAHINLLGAVMMLIFGVGYHILPRFSGRPLHNEGLSTVQLWINIIGLVGMFVSLLAAAYSTCRPAALRRGSLWRPLRPRRRAFRLEHVDDDLRSAAGADADQARAKPPAKGLMVNGIKWGGIQRIPPLCMCLAPDGRLSFGANPFRQPHSPDCASGLIALS